MDIIKELKGGSLSRTLVISDKGRLFVRKLVSRLTNREYGLVRWQSQIRKLQLFNKLIPNSVPCIHRIGEYGDDLFYDIPYYEQAINCSDIGLLEKNCDLIATKIVDRLREMASIEYGCTKGSLSAYIAEEVLSPLLLAKNLTVTGRLKLCENESMTFLKSVDACIARSKIIMQSFRDTDIKESLTHGNLTLENILWDPHLERIIMIDPYAETYCESLIGDVSQILQSTQSGYEYISNLFNEEGISAFQYPCDRIPQVLISFTGYLIDQLSAESWYCSSHLDIFRASQFTRMFPFKVERDPKLGVAFMMHGINLINQVSC